MTATDPKPLKLAVIGLGRAFMLTRPTLRDDPRVELVAACDPNADARAAFEREFAAPAYDDVTALCRDPAIEAVYVASPHELHAEHVRACAAHHKHVLIEKPIALILDDGLSMVRACADAGVHALVGPSHSFDEPVRQARELIESGALGRVRMIQALNYTDFLYRPRRPEELCTDAGGGVVFSQAVHQIDIVRLLAGGQATQITAMTGAWDDARPTEGAYSALIRFADGAFATLIYSGYAHFDSDIWQDHIGETGRAKASTAYGAARRKLAGVNSPEQESALKAQRTYGATSGMPANVAPAIGHEHFGPVIVACERGDIRITPRGLWVYEDNDYRFVAAVASPATRSNVITALVDALRHDRVPSQTAAWGVASLEACLALLESARLGQGVPLKHQVST